MPITQKPSPLTLGNLETGETMDAQYNPDLVDDQLDAAYAHQVIPGLSHELLQYTNTKNVSLSFDIGFDILGDDTLNANNIKGFIDQFMYQQRSASSVGTGSPPRLLIIWPNVYSMTCKLTSRKIAMRRFDLTLANDWFVFSLKLEEARVTRLFSEDVRTMAGLRTGQ